MIAWATALRPTSLRLRLHYDVPLGSHVLEHQLGTTAVEAAALAIVWTQSGPSTEKRAGSALKRRFDLSLQC